MGERRRLKLREDAEPLPVLSVHDALFVECKPVDKAHPAGSKYCDAGLSWFVAGDYAWAMQDALMIAYARHGRSLGDLTRAMKKRVKTLKIVSTLHGVPGAPAELRGEALHVSRHGRGFRWPHGKGDAVDIFVYHMWQGCDGIP